jgi:hypothetical protein
MSVKVHEAFSLDSFQDRLLFFDDFHGDQLQDEWVAAGTGTAVVVDAQTGGIIRLTTGALTNNLYTVSWGDIRSLHVDQKVTMEVRAKVNTITQIEGILAIQFDANNTVYFRASVGAGVGNWFIRCRNGGALTSLDSGIQLDASEHIFRIECFPTDEVHFYIDGVETTNSPITTNIPDDAADFLQPYLYIRTFENVAKSMDVDYVYLRQERA